MNDSNQNSKRDLVGTFSRYWTLTMSTFWLRFAYRQVTDKLSLIINCWGCAKLW